MTLDIYMGNRAEDFATPPQFVKWVEDYFEVKFDLDAAASIHNKKAPDFISKEMDSFKTDWYGNVWLNPPYGAMIPKFIERAVEQIYSNCESIYILVPARTDTKWFASACEHASRIYFLQGRLNFNHPSSVKNVNAPYASILIIFDDYKPLDMLRHVKAPLEARR